MLQKTYKFLFKKQVIGVQLKEANGLLADHGLALCSVLADFNDLLNCVAKKSELWLGFSNYTHCDRA